MNVTIKKLLNQTVNPDVKQVLNDCGEYYADAMASLQSAIDEFNSKECMARLRSK